MTLIRILHLEDDPLDAALIRGRLDAGGYGDQIEVVQNEAGFRQALGAGNYHLLLVDYRLPGFDGLTALRIALEITPETPVILVSGEMGEELAIASLKAGAADYVLKDNLNRLVPAVENALAQAETRRAKVRAEEALGDLARQWQDTFDAVSDSIFIVGKDHRIIRCNKAFLALVGKDGEEQVVGRACWEVVHGTDVPIDSCPLNVTLQQGVRASIEIPLGDKWVDAVTYPLKMTGTNNQHGAVHIIRDITAIKQTQIILKGQAEALESTNTALKVMLNHSRQAETELQDNFMSNINGLILPYLDQLEILSTNEAVLPYLSLIRSNLTNLATSFSKQLSSPVLGLTSREIQIADLIKQGKSSKEIAQLLRLSKGTVDCYRDQIRKKMEVKGKKVNLRTYLLSDFS